MTINIALNGFGRIGRQLTRLLSSEWGNGLRLVAINALEPLATAAHLLRYDSSQGTFAQAVSTMGQGLIIAEQPPIPFLNQADTSRLPWSALEVDLVIEASGQATDRPSASRHLQAGARQVLITAAATNPDITLCLGVNQQDYRPSQHRIVSGSSCTTNCLAPAAKLINDTFRISSCLTTFLHSYTSNQHLLDLPGPDLRRMRGVGGNLIPTPTSSVRQIPEVIPELRGKFDAIAVRVPTPRMHLASMTTLIERPTTREEVLNCFREAAEGRLQGIVAVSEAPLVSTDALGMSPSCVLDAGSIRVIGNLLQLMIWHDNESSYCKRMLDLVRYVGQSSGYRPCP